MPNFFGLPDDHMKKVYDMLFIMTTSGNWSFTEAYNFPIRLRNYYYETFVEMKKKEKEKIENAQN